MKYFSLNNERLTGSLWVPRVALLPISYTVVWPSVNRILAMCMKALEHSSRL